MALFLLTIHLKMQKNFDGLNIIGTMKICSRQGLFKRISVNHGAWSGRYRDIFVFLLHTGTCMLCVPIRMASLRRF